MNISREMADPGVSDAAVGGKVALDGLYRAHIDGAVRLAFLMTGDRDRAQDIAHDAFVKIAGRFHDLRHRDAFPAYLRATVLNLSRSHLRRLKVQRAYIDRETREPQQTSTRVDIEGREGMWQALQRLPHRRRAAIVLRYYEDLTEQQAADALGCSVPAVKALVARGLETLRAEMDREES